MKTDNYILPDKLLYNKDYSWVKIKENVATIGVIQPLANSVKEFVFIKLPKKGKISKGDIYVTLEALKWSGHLSNPLSGEIIEVNEYIYDHPSTINEDPYNKGWVFKVKLSNPNETKDLLKAEEIAKWVKESKNRK